MRLPIMFSGTGSLRKGSVLNEFRNLHGKSISEIFHDMTSDGRLRQDVGFSKLMDVLFYIAREQPFGPPVGVDCDRSN